MSDVDLGFVLEEKDLLIGINSTKIGGKPMWLELENLPKPCDLQCCKCKLPMSFLCQLFCQDEDEKREEAFYRIFYVFVCREKSCQYKHSAENFKVFRSQLPRKNNFYPEEVKEYEIVPPAISSKKLCFVCGCYATHDCSNCNEISYCSESHRNIHLPYHEKVCSKPIDSDTNQTCKFDKILFPELIIEIEQEFDPKSGSESDSDADEPEDEYNKYLDTPLDRYHQLCEAGEAGDSNNLPDADIEEFLKFAEEKHFSKFTEAIEPAPDQVIRYSRHSRPLWISDPQVTIQSSLINIPNCEKCGAERTYEFQIMPQMLNYLKDDRIDWGVLAVYTCSKSCHITEYVPEYLIKQDLE